MIMTWLYTLTIIIMFSLDDGSGESTKACCLKNLCIFFYPCFWILFAYICIYTLLVKVTRSPSLKFQQQQQQPQSWRERARGKLFYPLQTFIFHTYGFSSAHNTRNHVNCWQTQTGGENGALTTIILPSQVSTRVKSNFELLSILKTTMLYFFLCSFAKE